MLFRVVFRTTGRFYILIFPAIWVCIDLLRSVGEIAFPWAFLGYSLTPFLPTVQIASITGVWGVTFLVVLGNVLVFEVLTSYYRNENQLQKWIHASVFCMFIGCISCWGYFRMKHSLHGTTTKVSLIQSNIDQLHWGNNSLDEAFSITEKMIRDAAAEKPQLVIGPESALLCFLDRQSTLRRRVVGWANEIQTPLLLGALHWDKAPDAAAYEYYVYNSAFLIEPGSNVLTHYYKQKLVPFSEKMPFENSIPILSRVNLGEADFQSGIDPVIFTAGEIRAAPFICYEIIFPSFVQQRLKRDANLIVTITNDGWFGKTTGPFHHATMARMRAIENCVSIVRCANSGFSMFIDPYGRVQKQTSLYKREILTGETLLKSADTFYSRHGDWFLLMCSLISISGIVFSLVNSIFRKKKHAAQPTNVNVNKL